MSARNWRTPPQPKVHHCAKLTQEKVNLLREWYATGKYSQPELGEHFGVHTSTVRAIVQGLTWKRRV